MGMLPPGRGACQRANRFPNHVGGRDERALPGPCVRLPWAGLHGERPQGGIPSPHATRLPLFSRETDLRCARCALSLVADPSSVAVLPVSHGGC